MATSGSYNFSQNADELCTRALQKIGKQGIGRTVSNEDMTLVRNSLNMLLKKWSADPHLWTKEEGVLYLTQYTAKYSLGNASTDAKVTLKSEESITQLNGALAASATAVTVDSTSGMAVNDNIGIVLSDKTLHWTTIATLPSSTTLTLTTGVASAARDNAYVFSFTNKLYKPLRITSGRLVCGNNAGLASGYSETLMSPLPYATYQDMPSKHSNSSTPLQFVYNPKNTTGDFYVWPRPSDCSYRVEFTYVRAIEDVDTGTNDIDIPTEWYDPLLLALAADIAPDFGVEDKRTARLEKNAQIAYMNLISWDSEGLYLQLSPDLGNY